MAYWALLGFTLFWGVIGGILPWFVPKGPNRGIIQTMLVETAVCCYLYWLSTWLMQLNPLIGPEISNVAVRVMKYEWS